MSKGTSNASDKDTLAQLSTNLMRVLSPLKVNFPVDILHTV